MPTWTWAIPAVAILLLVIALAAGAGVIVTVLCVAALIGAVITSVHHAEVIAHRVGEPFGTLVLAIAATVIEASLIPGLAALFPLATRPWCCRRSPRPLRAARTAAHSSRSPRRRR